MLTASAFELVLFLTLNEINGESGRNQPHGIDSGKRYDDVDSKSFRTRVCLGSNVAVSGRGKFMHGVAR
jgi:hypothetical protein